MTSSAREGLGDREPERFRSLKVLPGLGESLADRGGDNAVADPSHVRRLAYERRHQTRVQTLRERGPVRPGGDRELDESEPRQAPVGVMAPCV
jgi:hypothetical protein